MTLIETIERDRVKMKLCKLRLETATCEEERAIARANLLRARRELEKRMGHAMDLGLLPINDDIIS